MLLFGENNDDVLASEPRLRNVDVTSACAEGALEDIITRLWNFDDAIPDNVLQRQVSDAVTSSLVGCS